MTFSNPAGLWALALAIPIVALHVLRSRRVEVVVSSTMSWQDLDRPVSAARPWQRLRRSISLLLQLLLVGLLALALSGLSLDSGRTSASHLVIIIDTSASMGATDGSPTRLDDAVRTARSMADDLGQGAVVTVIAAGAPARIVASRVEPSGLGSKLGSMKVSEGPFDATGAGSLALGLDSPDESVAYALISDGGLDGAAVRLLPSGTEYHRVGRRDLNLGITNLVASAVADQTHVRITVTNAGGSAATTGVRVDVDHEQAGSSSVRVPAHGTSEIGFDVPNGQSIAAHLDIDDLLASDNHSYAAGPAARALRVLRVGGANPFLDALLDGRESIAQTHVASVVPGSVDAATVDLVIFDQVEVPPDIAVPFLAIAPPGGAPGVSVLGTVKDPVAALVRSDNSLLAGLDLVDLAIAQSQKIDAPASSTLLGAEQTPLLVTGSRDGTPFIYQSFALADSNLGLLPQFPVLAERLIATLGRTDLSSGSLQVGDPLPVPEGVEVVVTSPSGTRSNVHPGALPPELDRTGIWTIAPVDPNVTDSSTGSDSGSRLVVVNPSPSETLVAPRKGLAIAGVEAAADAVRAPVRTSLVPPIVVLGLVVLALEWWFGTRRRGVPRRQWRVATMLRGVVAALLLGAVVTPQLTFRSNAVATVFVLDVSDSMTAARDQAAARIGDAVSAMSRGSAAGVVVVGRDARIDTAVAQAFEWSRVSIASDGSATDLAAGVRLAGAMLPDTHARRIVLISDGRPTAGDLATEVQRLRSAGIRLDVMPLDPLVGSDVMVETVNAPDRVRPDEPILVSARVRATEAQQVSVALKRDDRLVETKVVDVPEGVTSVEFTQPGGQPGVIDWSVSVGGPANGWIQNDLGRASTRVDGQAQVLMVEGSPGEGGRLAEVLRATGSAVHLIAPEELADASQLARIDALVLVNVPADALGGRQVDWITTATRDLGMGMVVIGGTASFGAGGYQGSRLEELLPVESEIRDPKRSSKVAQVFAVDVSGSMGACHCAEDGIGMNSRISSGIRKTDIARDAAVLSLSGIKSNDELGIMALDDEFRWLRDVTPVDNGSDARKAIGRLKSGDSGTNLLPGLVESAKQLRNSDAKIRHIVLFTDGFEDEGRLRQLAEEAATLRKDGITVSVMGTGEGAAQQLRAVAEAGGGRYYPGRDLNQLPNLLLTETKIVARQMLVEGDFLPEVTSNSPDVASLESAPRIKGYVATTLRPAATRDLTVGPERDPLLASWQVGLAKVIAWTSDAGSRWAGGWVGWDGAPEFWSNVMRAVHKSSAGSLAVDFGESSSMVTAEFDNAIGDGVAVVGTVSRPDGTSAEVRLTRVDDRTFKGRFEGEVAGAYTFAVTAGSPDNRVASITGVGQLGYSREYASTPADPGLLTDASLATGGRGSVRPDQSFDQQGLVPGNRRFDPGRWLLLVAALLWPVAVAVSRLRLASGADAVAARDRHGRLASVADAITAARRSGRPGAGVTGPDGPAASGEPPADASSMPPGPASERPRVGRSGRSDDVGGRGRSLDRVGRPGGDVGAPGRGRIGAVNEAIRASRRSKEG